MIGAQTGQAGGEERRGKRKCVAIQFPVRVHPNLALKPSFTSGVVGGDRGQMNKLEKLGAKGKGTWLIFIKVIIDDASPGPQVCLISQFCEVCAHAWCMSTLKVGLYLSPYPLAELG